MSDDGKNDIVPEIIVCIWQEFGIMKNKSALTLKLDAKWSHGCILIIICWWHNGGICALWIWISSG